MGLSFLNKFADLLFCRPPAWDVDFGADDLNDLGGDYGADVAADVKREAEAVGIEEAGCIGVARAGRIDSGGRVGLNKVGLGVGAYPATVLSDLDYCDAAKLGDFFD